MDYSFNIIATSTGPFIDKDRIYLMKNTTPFINAYDLDMNLVAKLGQDFSRQFSYYFTTLNVKNMRISNNKLYLQRGNSDFSTNIQILDLITGVTLKKFNIPFEFTDFYLKKSDVFFLAKNKMVSFNIEKERLNSVLFLNEIKENIENKNANDFCFSSTNEHIATFL